MRSALTVVVVVALGLGCSKNNEEAARAARAAKKSSTAMPVDPREHGAGDDAKGGATDPHAGMAGGPAQRPLDDLGGGHFGLGPLVLAVPAAWSLEPAGGMRAAAWKVPGAKAGDEAELVIYYFGDQGAGSVEANLDRWLGQFQGAGGAPAKDSAIVGKRQVAGQDATVVAVRGRYVTSMPGTGEKIDRPDQAMRGAIVPSPSGPYYFKLVGPAATVDGVGKDFDALLDSIATR